MRKGWKLAEQHAEQPDYYRNLAYRIFNQKDFNKALKAWEKEQVYVENFPGWMRLSLELEYVSRLGYCYAVIGDSVRAQETIEIIFSPKESELNSLGAQYYFQARILAGLGAEKEALESLEKALKNGYSFFRPAAFDTDPFLTPLSDYQPFQEF